jgi:PTS system nitrogen regulatory IIA component
MRLADLLHVERVSPSLEAGDKGGVLRELAALFHAAQADLDVASVHDVLARREALASTGVGSGVAIPHGRVAGLEQMQAAMGIHHQGVAFDAVDGRPAHIFVAVLAPERRPSDHLKALARISRLLRDEDVRRELLEASSAEAILELVAARE